MPGMRGRDREWQQLTHALNRVGLARRSLLVLEGPPGIGKTWLLGRFAAYAREHHVVVFEHRGPLPAIALAQVIAECQRIARQAAADGTPDAGAVLVAWDDPPWREEDVLAVARRTASRVPMLWALTRPAGFAPPGLAGGADVFCVDLVPLADDAVAELVAQHLGAGPSPRLLELTSIGGGNPGAVVDLLDGLREEELIDVRNGQADLVADRLPHRVLGRVRRQLSALSADARHLLQVAAMVGLSSRPNDLAALLRMSAASLLSTVDEALTAGLLHPGRDRLAFRHELVRAVIADSVPAPLRQTLRDAVSSVDSAPRGRNRRDWSVLTPTEQRVADLAGDAMTNQQIAHRMRISPHTVNYHLRQIFRKLDINSRVELAGWRRDAPEPTGGG